MEVESASASVPTATASTATTGVVVGSAVELPKPKPFLEGTSHSQTHIMTVNIDISDDNHDDTDYSTKVNGEVSTGATVTSSKNGSVSFEGVNGSSNKTVSSSSSSYSNNPHHHHHSPLLNGRNGGSSDIKRIQRTLVSEERLTAAWRKLSLLDLFYPSFMQNINIKMK